MSDSRRRVREFLDRHDTMTLATVGPSGEARAAAVFYAVDDELNLYFLSSPDSRHSLDLQRDPRVAATIQADGQDWREICGLQIEGTAHLVAGASETVRAARLFARRFDFLQGLLDDGVGEVPVALRGPLAESRFHVLRPARFRLIDNARGFGHKEEFRVDGPSDG
ncbi:MAG: pyridoxamine 5'-phosphate oxidase family protein [Phycisphaerae bacterium]|nr:pyridoxamine 5'-phosphate oxidase family protein [Phycisphaerae bacterium]